MNAKCQTQVGVGRKGKNALKTGARGEVRDLGFKEGQSWEREGCMSDGGRGRFQG